MKKAPPWVSGSVLGGDSALGGTGVQETELWPLLLLHTKDAHVVFALLLVLLNQVIKGVRKILEEHVLLVHLQAQDAVQEFGDGAVCESRGGQGMRCSWMWKPSAPSQRAPHSSPTMSLLTAAQSKGCSCEEAGDLQHRLFPQDLPLKANILARRPAKPTKSGVP